MLIRRERDTNSQFAGTEESNLASDTLLRCRVVKVAEGSEYAPNDVILVRADLLRVVKYDDCPSDILILQNSEMAYRYA